MSAIELQLTSEQKQQLERAAKQHGLSVEQYIHKAVVNQLDKRLGKKSRRAGQRIKLFH